MMTQGHKRGGATDYGMTNVIASSASVRLFLCLSHGQPEGGGVT